MSLPDTTELDLRCGAREGPRHVRDERQAWVCNGDRYRLSTQESEATLRWGPGLTPNVQRGHQTVFLGLAWVVAMAQ